MTMITTEVTPTRLSGGKLSTKVSLQPGAKANNGTPKVQRATALSKSRGRRICSCHGCSHPKSHRAARWGLRGTFSIFSHRGLLDIFRRLEATQPLLDSLDPKRFIE